MRDGSYRFGTTALFVGLAALALAPLLDRLAARHGAHRQLRGLEMLVLGKPQFERFETSPPERHSLLTLSMDPPLASWGSIGGCGASGGSGSPGGGLKWVGRNVSGGSLDTQAIATQSTSRGSDYRTLALRLGMALTPKWRLALNVPVLNKVGDVTVLGIGKTAHLSGFGDVSLDLGVKLGAIGSQHLSLVVTAPTGSSDAVRQGVVLPQHLQLGTGVPGASLMYEHTRDRDWGLVLLGGTVSYGGWENRVGDFRAPSATAYAHAGYLWGSWVPSAGLTVFAKASRDRERGSDRLPAADPRLMLMPSVGLEWSSEWVAVLPGFILGLSPRGIQSLTVGLGISSSLF